MELYLALAIPIILATAWLYTAQVTRTSLPSLRNKRICLLIAHPDDEAMFFSPTLLALTAQETGNHVKILCLSSGSFMQIATSLGYSYTDFIHTKGMPMALERSASKSSLPRVRCSVYAPHLTSLLSKTRSFRTA